VSKIDDMLRELFERVTSTDDDDCGDPLCPVHGKKPRLVGALVIGPEETDGDKAESDTLHRYMNTPPPECTDKSCPAYGTPHGHAG
jgi:hypothetical protein